jgi:hypothetical protein
MGARKHSPLADIRGSDAPKGDVVPQVASFRIIATLLVR